MRLAPWIHSRPVDLTLILGVTALALAMGVAVELDPRLFLPLLTLHIWLFGYDHVIATFTKLAGLPEDRRRNRWMILHLPPLVLVAVFAVGAGLGLKALNSVYFFWQLFHVTRQSWGLAQHYRRQAGGLPWDPARLSEATLWSVPLWGALNRSHQQPEHFLYVELWTPAVPIQAVYAAGALALSLWLHFFLTRVRAWRRGELPLGHTLYMLTHLVVFALAYGGLRDINAGWLLVNVWHNVQYQVYVYMHNRQRFAAGVRPDARWLSWLSQPGGARALAYFAACLALSTPLYYGLYSVTDRLDGWLAGRVVSLSLVVGLTLNFHHYVVDGVIWKRRRTA